MLPRPGSASGIVTKTLPDRLRWSLAVSRIETTGAWVPDEASGAFRVPRARVAELWVSPTAVRSAEHLASEYGVRTPAAAVTPSSGCCRLWRGVAASLCGDRTPTQSRRSTPTTRCPSLGPDTPCLSGRGGRPKRGAASSPR